MIRLIKNFALLGILLSMHGCREKNDTPAQSFKLGTVSYSVDFSECKVEGSNYVIIGYHIVNDAPTDVQCKITFFGYTTPPPDGNYILKGNTANSTTGYADANISGGHIFTWSGSGWYGTPSGTYGYLTLSGGNSKPLVTFKRVTFATGHFRDEPVLGEGRFGCP